VVTCFVARVVGVWWRENCVCHRTAFCPVLLNVLCLPSNFQAVKWHLNVTEVLVPDLMSTDAFVLVWRPVYRSNLTHVATLISFFLKGSFSCHGVCCKQTRVFTFCRKGSCSCYRVCCKQTCVFIFCCKARTVWTNVALCCPSLWRKKQFDLTYKKLRFFLGDDTLLPISFTSCFPVFIY